MTDTEQSMSGFSLMKNMSASQIELMTLLIDAEYYGAQAFLDPDNVGKLVSNFIQDGWRNDFDPTPTFRGAHYLKAASRLADADINKFAHYLFETVGEAALNGAFHGLSAAEIVKLRIHFNTSWYLHLYPGVATRGNDPFIYYMTLGWLEGQDPSPRFSTGSYLKRYADIRDCGVNPFRHWVFHGIAEGRSGNDTPRLPFTSWEGLSESQRSILVHMFDINYYQSYAAGAGFGQGSPLAEYIHSGRTGVGDITPSFRASRYIQDHPDLVETGEAPFLQFLFGLVGESALRELFLTLPAKDVQTISEHFETAWYLYSNPDVEKSGMDAFIHYMAFGWRQNRDPSPSFSTSAYLSRYPDIVECGMNPFLHWVLYGRLEGRSGPSSSSSFRKRSYAPSTMAVLVNTEAHPLSADCLATVLQQSYGDLSVLVIGTTLSNVCRPILEAFAGAENAKAVNFLPDNGASPHWKLLERAVEYANTELIWFVQGRGVHDPDFLARLTSSFADGSVQLGFGRCLEQDDDENTIDEMRSMLQKDGWTRHSTTPAALWFSDNLRVDLLGLEQPSFLWRRRELTEDVWRRAGDYRYLGHWSLYLQMAAGGQIASVRDALGQVLPDLATSTSKLEDEELHHDVIRLAADIRSLWHVSRDTLDACAESLADARAFHMSSPDARSDVALYDEPLTLEMARVKRHVLIVTHGIFAGGAENFPIQLANDLIGHGTIVSMLIFRTHDVNAEMRATLNPGVSIYEADWVLEYGCEKFVRDIGCSLIHSHGVVGEMFFFQRCDCTLSVPYIATLHGSYEASTSEDLPESVIARIVRSVDIFVYTADKNLAPLLRHKVGPERRVKMINAMPVDETPLPQTRADLRIAEDAVVFTLIARGIKEKGWSTAIKSFQAVKKRNPHRAMHLCLVGEGDEPNRLQPLYAGDASISFMGFQLRIHGLYRMTDVAIVPTRFAGESYPLCIIQALQAAVPIIATNIGEIPSMLQNNGVSGGIVVKSSPSDKRFEKRFADAMHKLVNDKRRRQLSLGANLLGEGYDMNALTEQYVALYERASREFAAARSTLSVGHDGPSRARPPLPSSRLRR